METKALERVVYEKDAEAGIARIILNFPEKANAQDSRLAWDVDACLDEADRDYEVKVVILKSNGKGFCAGHAIFAGPQEEVYPDFYHSIEHTGSAWKGQLDLFVWPVLHLWEFPKPTIAQVHGYCLGGGTYYGLLTDMTVASEDAYFQMPLVQGLGLPGGETMIEPYVFMNWKRAARYLYTAQTLSAQDALAQGLVNEVVPREKLEETVEELARQVAAAPLSTLMATKALLKRAWEQMGMRMLMQMSNDLLTVAAHTSDVQRLREQRGSSRPRQWAEQQTRAAST
ncbi:MAG TPA: enoyl-CoA hydratase-related protein [Acidimicrobiales bacterium]|nr:enoyl-CoA hydratase-related protein [Acidimicrobiales bacterium]